MLLIQKELEIAKKTFENVSFDMIYATPEQTVQDWASEIRQAIEFSSNHISVYQLTIERGTAFFKNIVRGISNAGWRNASRLV